MSNIITLKDEAKLEIYKYIDKEMRKLPKAENGEFDEFQEGYQDNDVDALRHAYVSGVYCMKYGKRTSDLFGRLNEYFNLNYSKISKKSQNMDLWNNAIGRKYGARANSKKELIEKLIHALKNGELITDPEDKRKYKGERVIKRIPSSLVVKIEETDSGENIMFYDVSQKVVMTKEEFIDQIKAEKYTKYSIRIVDGVEIPFSKRDRFKFNNLG